MTIQKKNFTRGIRIKPDNIALEGKEGEIKVGETSKKIETFLDGAARSVVTENQTQTLTNKTISANNNVIGVSAAGITATELNNALAELQTNKQNNITGAASTVTTANLAVDSVVVTNASGKIAASTTVSTTELGYLDGVTSAIQTQLNAKADLASPTFTGDPKAPTAAFGDNDTSIATTAYVRANTLPLQNNISSGIDLDTVTTTGIYHQTNNSGAAAGTNYPAPYAGKLEVFSNGSMTYQTYHTYQQQEAIYFRGRYNSVWSAWKKVTSDDQLTEMVTSISTSSVDNTIPRFDGVDGKIIQSSGVSINDSNVMSGLTGITSSGTATLSGALHLSSNTTNSQNGDGVVITAATSNVIRLTGATLNSIAGYAGVANGRITYLINASATPVTILNDSALATTATNRIITGTGGDIVLPSGASIELLYNETTQRHQVVGGVGSGGGKSLDTLFQLTADEPTSDWTSLSGFSISKTNPIQGGASYVLSMTNLYAATRKVIPVDEVFRGKTLALTLDYTMTQGAARVKLLDQTDTIIEGTTFDLAVGSGIQKFGTTVFIPSTVTGIRFQMEARATVASQSIKFDNVELSSDVLGVIDYSTIPVGTIVESMLTEAQIQAQSGAGIILADGRNVTGSRYHAITGNTHVPDLRGVFTRGKNNGRNDGKQNPDGEKSLGEYQDDALQTHTHTQYAGNSHPWWNDGGSSVSALRAAVETSAPNGAKTSTETRPRNVTVNYFIKINDTNLSIVAPTDQVTERSIAFNFKSTALTASDPIGTYNTYTYAANTNTMTRASTRPTQTDADMSVNGVRVFTRAYNAASTAASPARFEIKIAEPNQMAACEIDSFKDTTRAIKGITDFWSYGAYQVGVPVREFNPATGILTIDVGGCPAGSVIAASDIPFVDGASQKNGYICFTASKLAQGVAIPRPLVAYLKDVKSSGTNGGTFTAGAWQTRTLNTVEGDTSFVTLSGNQVTIGPGKYEIEASAPGRSVGLHTLRLYNITTSNYMFIGGTAFAEPSTASQTDSSIYGVINITQTTTFEVQHRCSVTVTSNGLGFATSFGVPEIYTQLKIKKVL